MPLPSRRRSLAHEVSPLPAKRSFSEPRERSLKPKAGLQGPLGRSPSEPRERSVIKNSKLRIKNCGEPPRANYRPPTVLLRSSYRPMTGGGRLSPQRAGIGDGCPLGGRGGGWADGAYADGAVEASDRSHRGHMAWLWMADGCGWLWMVASWWKSSTHLHVKSAMLHTLLAVHG